MASKRRNITKHNITAREVRKLHTAHRQHLAKDMVELDLEIKVISRAELRYLTLRWKRAKGHLVSNDTLDRWMVGYVRHNFTNYNEICKALRKTLDSLDAYSIVKERVLKLIGRNYHFLANECERQINTLRWERNFRR